MKGKAMIKVVVDYTTDAPMNTDEVSEMIRRAVKVPLRIADPKMDGGVKLEIVKIHVQL